MFQDDLLTEIIDLFYNFTENNTHKTPHKIISSPAVDWAKHYYHNIVYSTHKEEHKNETLFADFTTINFLDNRASTVDKLLESLKVASEIAWGKVESIFGLEIISHGINEDLIQPAQMRNDSRHLYRDVIITYADQEKPSRLSVLLGKNFREIRRKYTDADPLVLGFMVMQCHYVGQMLSRCLSPQEKLDFLPYLKSLEDYLYIPFREIHKLAAEHHPNSPELNAVQHLLPSTTQIAEAVYQRASKKYQGYRSNSGSLNKLMVKLSSIRDVEIFQCYLCWCVLEGSMAPIQEELFPLCVMLYPRLNVSWKLVQDMLLFMFWEIYDRVSPEEVMIFLPYLRTLMEMFSDEVFSR
jgi:hypothetical protein